MVTATMLLGPTAAVAELHRHELLADAERHRLARTARAARRARRAERRVPAPAIAEREPVDPTANDTRGRRYAVPR